MIEARTIHGCAGSWEPNAGIASVKSLCSKTKPTTRGSSVIAGSKAQWSPPGYVWPTAVSHFTFLKCTRACMILGGVRKISPSTTWSSALVDQPAGASFSVTSGSIPGVTRGP